MEPSRMLLKVGQTLGPYRIIGRVGAPWTGYDYRARYERLNREVVIRILPSGTFSGAAARRRFATRFRVLAGFEHPNLQTVLDLDHQEGLDFLVLEFVRGTSLSRRMAKGRLRDPVVFIWGLEMAEGLAAAHDHGFVHGELRPDNILVSPDGDLKMTHAGLPSLLLGAESPRHAEGSITVRLRQRNLRYTSPEQVRGDAPDPRSDIWAAGTVLYEMTTGHTAFPQRQVREQAAAILDPSPWLPSKAAPRMARGLEAIIQKCLNKEPSNRYQSGRELASALQSASRAVDLIEQLGAGARATAAKAGPFDFIHASREPGERPPKKEEKYQVVEVLYATDRKATGKTAPGKFFGGERSDGSSLSLGICEVSIPFDHKIGELESPSILKLEFSPDPEEHIALLRIEPATEAGFYLHLSSRVAASARSGAFVFIHGYSVTFEDAARRTAQLAYDLKFSGPPIFYSWPSQGAKAKYTVDETNIEWTIPHLQGFLARIASESGATTLHLIAHSMGNRALTRALVELSRAAVEATDRPRFRQIVLTAPDIDADVFRQLAAAMQKAAERITLYASSEDEALKLSKKFHGYPRAGDVGESIVVCPGVDTVDVSAVDTSLLGHSYYGDNRSVIGDLFNLLQDGAPPSQRFGLLPVKWKELQYWRFQP